MTISASRWSLRTDLPHPVPHRAAAPRATPTLHLEWHVGGVKAHEGWFKTATSALLNMPDVIRANRSCGVLMFQSGRVLLPWSEREVTCGE